MGYTREYFDELDDLGQIDLIRLENSNGLTAEILTLGATLRSLRVPDKNNIMADIVLGYDNAADYLKGQRYYGATIGRYANRIGNAQFKLNDKVIKLTLNDHGNLCHCHGGQNGFNRVLWTPVLFEREDGSGVRFFYFSKENEEGYPGNLNVWVTYFLSQDNQLEINFHADTDVETVINMTHHSYFNLSGHDQGDILDHEMMLESDKFTPVDENLIPTGQIQTVQDGPMDFTKPQKIGKRLHQVPGGYNHNYVIRNHRGKLARAGHIKDPRSGRKMEVLTTQPGVQFNSGNLIDENDSCKNSINYPQYGGFTFQTQNFPDAPNKPHFPSPVIKPGVDYYHQTVYKFSVDI